MPRILVMRYDDGKLPPSDLTEEKRKEIEKKVMKFLEANLDVAFNGLWVNEDGVGVCDWNAPDAETVRTIVESVGMPYDEIIEVKRVMHFQIRYY